MIGWFTAIFFCHALNFWRRLYASMTKVLKDMLLCLLCRGNIICQNLYDTLTANP